jgi:hypothetical protein
MVPILRPLFRYRKYQIAGLLLKICVHNYAVAIHVIDDNLNERQMYHKAYASYQLNNFIIGNSKISPERVLEATDLLHANGHVEKQDNSDIYKVVIKCNKEGERAYNDGFYITQAYKEIRKAVGIASGILAILLSMLKWGCPLIQFLLNIN